MTHSGDVLCPSTRSRLPGFGLSLGFTLFYLSLIVLIPLRRSCCGRSNFTWDFWTAITSPRVVASLRLTFGAALAAAVIDTVFGFIVAWVLVRYHFPGKRLSMPCRSALRAAHRGGGHCAAALYAPNGWIGALSRRSASRSPSRRWACWWR